MQLSITQLYRQRFRNEIEQRNNLWKILCKDFFQRYVDVNDVVVDLGAGFCEFINNISAKKKIAIDLNPDVKNYSQKEVEVMILPSTRMSKKVKSKADVVFASNFFEHLATKEELAETLIEVGNVLKQNGKFLILMPNLRYIGAAYWDFIDHQLPLTDKSMVEALELNGFEVLELKKRFLPYTTKSKIPKAEPLIKLYLKLPILQFIFGKQSFIVAKKKS